MEMETNLSTDNKGQGQSSKEKEKPATSDGKESSKSVHDVDTEDVTPEILLEGEGCLI